MEGYLSFSNIEDASSASNAPAATQSRHVFPGEPDVASNQQKRGQKLPELVQEVHLADVGHWDELLCVPAHIFLSLIQLTLKTINTAHIEVISHLRLLCPLWSSKGILEPICVLTCPALATTSGKRLSLAMALLDSLNQVQRPVRHDKIETLCHLNE